MLKTNLKQWDKYSKNKKLNVINKLYQKIILIISGTIFILFWILIWFQLIFPGLQYHNSFWQMKKNVLVEIFGIFNSCKDKCRWWNAQLILLSYKCSRQGSDIVAKRYSCRNPFEDSEQTMTLSERSQMKKLWLILNMVLLKKVAHAMRLTNFEL